MLLSLDHHNGAPRKACLLQRERHTVPRRGCHEWVQVVSIRLFKDIRETVMGSGKQRMRFWAAPFPKEL